MLPLHLGAEWLIDAAGCDPARLADLAVMQRLCDSVIDELGLHVLGRPQWRQFPAPGGVTGLYLLSESHLACHTFPEHARAAFNLYCCRPRDAWPWSERLGQWLGATDVRVRRVDRGDEIEALPKLAAAASGAGP